jgi:hypothetical protein
VYKELKLKTENLPFVQNRKLLYVLFLKQMPEKIPDDAIIFTPDDVVGALK